MDITFADRNLRKFANNYSLAQRKMGDKRAKLYHQRLDDMKDSLSFDDLDKLPGNFHNLSANRNGQWACDLDHPYRLIFEPGISPVPTNEHGTILLNEIE
ncbi:hypothetical protein RZS08_45025, partial [Arthrospira platensis SPKY1]|nr:hypothetical protein [Arthrospira platensis SPKY1]